MTDGPDPTTTDRLDGRLAGGGGPMTRDRSLLIVGGETAVGLAYHLGSDHDVTVVTGDDDVVKNAHEEGIDVRTAEITQADELAPITDGVETAVVAAERDQVGLLSAQLLRTTCGVEDVTVLLNDPVHGDLFDDLDVEYLERPTVLGPEVERTLFGKAT